MDSQQLIEYLYLSKASIRRALAELEYAGDNVEDFRHVLDTVKQHLHMAMDNTRSAITEMAEVTEAENVDELDTIFNRASTTEETAEDFFATHEHQDLYSRACEVALRKGKISSDILENRLEIESALAARLIDKLVEEGIISPQAHDGMYDLNEF